LDRGFRWRREKKMEERKADPAAEHSGETREEKKKPDIKRLLLIGIPMLIAAVALSTLDSEARLLWFEDNTPTETTARFFRFSGEKVRRVDVGAEERLELKWEDRSKSGELWVEVRSGGRRRTRLEGESASWSVRPEERAAYRLIIHGDAARGSFTLSWRISEGDG
jgi:hypothetical protein